MLLRSCYVELTQMQPQVKAALTPSLRPLSAKRNVANKHEKVPPKDLAKLSQGYDLAARVFANDRARTDPNRLRGKVVTAAVADRLL